ncbi:Lrp/AsnC family transcriptional regulator [Thiohalobacter sp. IOR34]|uniref:Lrp/AsnC family transcriptional regulator n=1 Tax=Thiohalobacter sp. IOR34 TaxID=3057176 RepID=UPI0025B20B8B|nr:Lrp/AsnC family transcriptional regulator [Thiohalobacter sp. IOR34]WJW75434.1 Lrp/AsnC family transcriptional regulator [Thiohalobacter sp. IOR34]
MSHRSTSHDALQPGPLERRLLNDFQRGLPLTPRPFAAMAERLGVSEEAVLDALQALQAAGAVARVGPVLDPHRVGASTLAAMAVPAERLEAVAARVSACTAVNHNYEREHAFNLWFVATAEDEAALAEVLDGIERDTGCAVMALPMEQDYHIDLGFELQWR